MTYRRTVSGTEKAWLVAGDLFPPFTGALVIEGGGPLDREAWERAVRVAEVANPGARLVRRGVGCGMHWEPGPGVRVREVDGSDWDGRGPDGAAFLDVPLDPVAGPTTEVLLLRGQPSRVVVRWPHATMDGGGVLAFVRDVGRALRGEPCDGHLDTLTDAELARRRGQGGHRPTAKDALPVTGVPSGPARGVVWRRLSLDRSPRGLLGRVAATTAAHAYAHDDGPGVVRFDIPGDLRRQHPEVRSTANLTGMFPIEVGRGATADEVVAQVRDAVAEDAAGAAIRAVAGLRHVPLPLMRWIAARGARQHHATGRYDSSGVLSNVGWLDPTAYSGAGFVAERLWIVPTLSPVTPFFVVLAGGPAGVDLVVATPDCLGDGGRLDAVVTELEAALRHP